MGERTVKFHVSRTRRNVNQSLQDVLKFSFVCSKALFNDRFHFFSVSPFISMHPCVFVCVCLLLAICDSIKCTPNLLDVNFHTELISHGLTRSQNL